MLLRKLKPIVSRSLAFQQKFQPHFSNSTEDQMKIKSFDEGNASLSLSIINVINEQKYLKHLREFSLVDQILSII